jgi:hypothetical protein
MLLELPAPLIGEEPLPAPLIGEEPVLVYIKSGSPGRIRTYNISVNSRTLYH